MRRPGYIFFICFAISLALGCRHRGTQLHVLVNRVDGLGKSSPVMYNGVNVGEVRRMKLLGDSVLVTIRLNQELNIPLGSGFVVNYPVLGQCTVNIEPSSQTSFFRPGDTARGSYQAKQLIENEWTDSSRTSRNNQAMRKIIEGILMLADTTGRDSASRLH